MKAAQKPIQEFFADYCSRLTAAVTDADFAPVEQLAYDLQSCWSDGHQVFICGNGGSAGNAIHLANDFLYGVAKKNGGGMRVSALPANSAVISCLANDIGYEHIFSEQIAVQGRAGDLLIALSGSGNSANIVKAIEQAKALGIKTYAILGFTGGKSLDIVDSPIHFAVDDMQISEDIQLIVGHMLMQWLFLNPPNRS